jgi:hypothetical protein
MSTISTAQSQFHERCLSLNLLEELVPRILRLAVLALRVVTVLADDQHGVDREFVSSTPQRFRDRRIKWDVELFRPRLAEIVFGLLVGIDRHDVERRLAPLAVHRVTDEEAISHVLGVRLVAPDRRDNGHLLARSRGGVSRKGERGSHQPCTRGAEKVASCEHAFLPGEIQRRVRSTSKCAIVAERARNLQCSALLRRERFQRCKV